MDTEPIAVALKFGFLAVLYLFLLWIAASAFRELRRTTVPAPEATGVHPIGPGGRSAATDAWLVAVTGGGLDPGERFDLCGGSYYAEDMNSTNGTYLNGGLLKGEAELKDLDELRIGGTELRFELDVPE